MTVLAHQNYRTYLRELMAEKARKNPSYSMRAMAKSLSLAPSFLSTVLKGKKNFSLKTSIKVARKLHLRRPENEYFCLLTQIDAAKDPMVKENLLEQLRHFKPEAAVTDMTVDRFRLISDWYHFAILAALEIDGFEASARQFAVALNLSQAEVELALERLERLGMVERGDRSCYQKRARNPRVESAMPNAALRSFHRQTLAKAIDSLETQSPREKIIGSETVAIDSDQLPAFNQLANDFFDRVLALAKKSKRRDSVYHLGVQLFNLTPSLRAKKKKGVPRES